MEIEIAREKIRKAVKSGAAKGTYMHYRRLSSFSSWLSDSRAHLQAIKRSPTDERGFYYASGRWYYFYLYDIDPNISIEEIKYNYVRDIEFPSYSTLYNIKIYAKEGKKSFEFTNPYSYVTSEMSFYLPEKKDAEDFVSGLKTLIELTPEWNKSRIKKRIETD